MKNVTFFLFDVSKKWKEDRREERKVIVKKKWNGDRKY